MIKLVCIFIIFLTSLNTFISTQAAPKVAAVEIIVTSQVEPLKSNLGTTQLRIVDNSGLIIVPKVKVTKVEVLKPIIQDTPSVEEKKETEKKPETKTATIETKSKAKPEIEQKKDIKPNPENKLVKTGTDIEKVPEPVISEPVKIVTEPKTETKKEVLSVEGVKELIQKYAQKYDQNPELMLKLADCESRFKADIVGSGRYFGVYQFSRATFDQYAKELKIQDPDPLNPEHNVEVAAYMIQNGQIARWGCKV